MILGYAPYIFGMIEEQEKLFRTSSIYVREKFYLLLDNTRIVRLLKYENVSVLVSQAMIIYILKLMQAAALVGHYEKKLVYKRLTEMN